MDRGRIGEYSSEIDYLEVHYQQDGQWFCSASRQGSEGRSQKNKVWKSEAES